MKTLIGNKALLVPFLLSALLNLIIWGLLGWRLVRLGGDAILHYTIYFGVDRLGPAWHILYVPLTGLVLLLINVAIVNRRQERDLTAFVLIYISLVIQALLAVAAFLLVLVNI